MLRVRRGGIASLGWLLVFHFDALEADFQRHYTTALPAAIWGPDRISIRRFAVLIRGLPERSATLLALDERKGWDNTNELLALVAELIDLGNRNFFAANTEKGTRPPEPLRIQRPGDEAPARAMSTTEDLARFFGGAVRHDQNGGVEP